MNKAAAFVRLDFITVKPYLSTKNFLIFGMVALSMLISSGTSIAAIGILMVYAALYASYPFAVCEKSGIDGLYTTLSIKRSTVVFGRYLFALIIDVCAGLVAFILSFAVLTVMQKDFNVLESFAVVIVMLVVYSTIQAVQLPVYFKLGYSGAKFLAYLPFFGFGIAGLAISKLLVNDTIPMAKISGLIEWIEGNTFLGVLIGVVVWLGIMFVSYKISLAYYNKRDF